jgi:hypothetical protein
MKKSVKALRNPYSAPFLETLNLSANIKYIVPAFFGDQFVEKDGGLRTYKPSAEEVRGWKVFLY